MAYLYQVAFEDEDEIYFEECDWGIPNSRGPYYAGSNAWHKRHADGLPVEGCECRECMAAARRIGRDAKTEEFISVKEAQRRPATTVVETIKTKPKPKRK